MNNQTKLFKDLVELNSYLEKLVSNFKDVISKTLDEKKTAYYEGRVHQLKDCIVFIEEILDKNDYGVEKVADKKLVKEVITRFYK